MWESFDSVVNASLIYAAGVLSHPGLRMFGLLLAGFGHLSSISVLLRESKTARIIAGTTLVVGSVLFITGCASNGLSREEEGELISNNVMGTPYCVDLQRRMCLSVGQLLDCRSKFDSVKYKFGFSKDDPCADLSARKLSIESEYSFCARKYANNSIMVNPMNRFRSCRSARLSSDNP